MSDNLVVDEAVRQAELAKLKAELAAAEARVALAQAEVLLAQAEKSTEQAKAEITGAPAVPLLPTPPPFPASTATAPPPAREPPPIPAPPPMPSANGNGAAKQPVAGPPTEVTPAPPLPSPPASTSTTAPTPKSSVVAPPVHPASAPPKQTVWSDAPATKDGAAKSVVLEGDYEDDDAPRGLQRSLIWAGTAWGSSMLVHMVLLLVLGAITIATQGTQVVSEIVSSIVERPDEIVSQVLEQDLQPSKDLALVSTSLSSATGMQGKTSVMSEPKVAATPTSNPTAVKVDIGEVNVFKSTGTQLSRELPEGSLGEPLAVADNYGDAMDRITQEILIRLAKSKVLVIWCFDQSESMKDDREEIMGRIDRVYKELGLAKSAQGDALLTAVCSYGQKAMTHTRKPTSNVEEILTAMNSVPIDPSGFEMQCQAASYAIQNHHGYAVQGQRQLMLIMVTDESGDPTSNQQYLESTILEAKAARCPIYVLGREAVFGYPYAQMRWRDPMSGRDFWLQIDRGPETPFPEQLQFDGFRRRFDAHPSGFGPYEQTRMARQTGGIFFMLPSPEVNLVGRDSRKYTLDAMRPYLPDLSARSDYVSERDKHPLRAIAWKVIADLNPYNAQIKRDLEFNRGRFSIVPAEFASEASPEMARAKQVILYLSDAQKAMEQVKSQREREASPRWRANFDLIYAQTIAYQVRLYEYGAAFDAMIKTPKTVKNIYGPKNPTTNWDIYPIARTITDSKTQEMREKATALYRQMTVEHAGTPYATRAQWELGRSFGYDFREHHQPPPRPGGGGTPPVKLPKL